MRGLFEKIQKIKDENLKEKIQKLRLKQHETNLSNVEKLAIDREILELKSKHHRKQK